jgi:hypothetical protein
VSVCPVICLEYTLYRHRLLLTGEHVRRVYTYGMGGRAATERNPNVRRYYRTVLGSTVRFTDTRYVNGRNSQYDTVVLV